MSVSTFYVENDKVVIKNEYGLAQKAAVLTLFDICWSLQRLQKLTNTTANLFYNSKTPGFGLHYDWLIELC